MKTLRTYSILFISSILVTLHSCGPVHSEDSVKSDTTTVSDSVAVEEIAPPAPTYDTTDYRKKITYMLNGDSSGKWPADQVIPREGAILPFKRVIAYDESNQYYTFSILREKRIAFSKRNGRSDGLF